MMISERTKGMTKHNEDEINLIISNLREVTAEEKATILTNAKKRIRPNLGNLIFTTSKSSGNLATVTLEKIAAIMSFFS